MLKHHGFSDVKSGQRKLVIWLRDNYKDMLEDPNAGIDQLFFKQGSRISIPGKQETAEIIGLTVTSGMTATREVQVPPQLSDIKVLDMEGNEIRDNKWAMGKPLAVSVKCRNGGEQTKVKFAVYQKKNDGGYEKAADELEGAKTEGEDRYTVEWKYEYSGEELKSRPMVYIKAYGDNIEEADSKEIEIGMDIKLVVVDDDNVVLGKAKIDIEFSKNDQEDKQGNQSKKFPGLEADGGGKYQWEGLIPDQAIITVRTPVERPYPLDANGGLKKHTVNPDTDKMIDTLNKIDGNDLIKNKIAGTIQNQTANTNQNQVHELDMGKLNVIKLPVRYLNQGERDLVEEILGDQYFSTHIKTKQIQIYRFDTGGGITGNPTVKQLREVLQAYSLNEPLCFRGQSDNYIETNLQNGLSLPTGIIYLPNISWFTDNNQLNARLVHEVFHQYQYKSGNERGVFQTLIDEMDQFLGRINDPYEYQKFATSFDSSGVGIKSSIGSLEQIGTLEGKAQFIEDFALAHYGVQPAKYKISDYTPAMTNSAGSGITTNVPLSP
jgi:hypothetical protein